MRLFRSVALSLGALLGMSGLAYALVRVQVDLSTQRMNVSTGDGESYSWPISSGRAGHLTPRGRFHPQRMFAMVHSAKYNNAPMPHSIFFTGAYAIHGTNAVGALGRPASHGCIRLAPGNAAKLYELVQAEGASISIVGALPEGYRQVAAHRHRRVASALAYAPHRRARSLREWMEDPIGPR